MFHVLLSQLSRASQPPTEAMSRRSGVDPKKNESNYISNTVSLIRSKVKTTFFVQNSNILTRFIKIFCFLSASEIFRRSDTWFRSRQCFEQNSRIALTNFCHDLTRLKIGTVFGKTHPATYYLWMTFPEFTRKAKIFEKKFDEFSSICQ